MAEAGPALWKLQHKDDLAPEVAHRRAEPRQLSASGPLRAAQEAAWGGLTAEGGLALGSDSSLFHQKFARQKAVDG